MNKSDAGKLGAASQLRSGKNRWSNLHIRMELEYSSNPNKCGQCGTILEYKNRRNKFCSRGCAATYHNFGRARNIKSGTYSKKPCLCCSKPTESKYCSNKCQKQFEYSKFISDWLSNKVSGNIDSDLQVSARIRRWLIETRGNRCEKCGWSEVNPTTGTVPIEIDHIDGNSRNTRPENIRLLCPNCHSLTPTHGVLNKGNGRRYKHRKYMQV